MQVLHTRFVGCCQQPFCRWRKDAGFWPSPYACEINTLLITILAIEQSLYKMSHDVVILIDNQDIARNFKCILEELANYPPKSREYRCFPKEICYHLRNVPLNCLHSVWIPSHDKQSDWHPPLLLTVTACRHVNRLADAATSDVLKQHAAQCFLENR